jgi:hypothetical protein
MNANTHGETAKIYQFPTPSQRAAADRRESSDTITERMSQRVCEAVGACWYHEAAIKQAATRQPTGSQART